MLTFTYGTPFKDCISDHKNKSVLEVEAVLFFRNKQTQPCYLRCQNLTEVNDIFKVLPRYFFFDTFGVSDIKLQTVCS